MLWKISGYSRSRKLPMILIEAESLDEALAEARSVSSDYNTAQPVDYDGESYLTERTFVSRG